MRPLLFGIDRRQMLPGFAFASESVTLDLLGFSDIRDVPPGSAIFIDQNRVVHEKKLQAAPFRPCIFEYIYFARPDSYLNKINVYQSRVDLGKKLARVIQKSGLEIDVVVPVPDSSRPAAIEIARLLKLKYREGLVKNRYIGRTFIMPGDQVRQRIDPPQAEPHRRRVPGQERADRGRFDRARQHVALHHPDGAPGRRQQRLFRLLLRPADQPLRLRHRHADQVRVHRQRVERGGDRRQASAPTA